MNALKVFLEITWHRTRIACLMFLLALPTGALALLAGAPPDSPANRVDANSTTSTWAGVGSITVDGSSFSATVINKHFVLTAAHVVKGAAVNAVTFNLNYDSALSQQIPASAIFIHPGFVSFNNPDLQHDIALVELASDVPAGVPIYDLFFGNVSAGTTFTMVGYGASGQGNTGITVGSSASVKRVGKNNADQFQADIDGSGRNAIFVFDFDGAGATNYMGSASLGNTIETTLAPGDSGSPSFINSGGWKVAGVNTFTTAFSGGPTTAGVFGTGGGGNLVYPYQTWINGVLASNPPDVDVPTLPEWGIYVFSMALLGITLRRYNRSRERDGNGLN